MNRPSAWVVGFLLLWGAARPVPAATTPETDKRIRADLMARKFTARVNLYEATVDETGKVESDSDDGDAIKTGMPILMKGVQFGTHSVRISMKNPEKGDKVWVEFVFSQGLSPDFAREREIFERMLAAAFKEARAGEAPQEGN